MALGQLGQTIANQGANRLPNKGGTTKKAKAKPRLTAKERAAARLEADPYGNRGGRGVKRKRVVRKRVRRRRVGGGTQTQTTSELNKAAKQESAGKTAKSGHAGKGQGTHHANSNSHMFPRLNAQGNLAKMSQKHAANQAGKPGGPQTATGQKMYTLKGLKGYLSNDYSMMKANSNDNSFTYRTAEARQLEATIGTMLAGATKQGKKKDDKKTKNDSRLTPAAFGQKKGLLRQLLAMSEPNAPLPEGLPKDYKPFEGVA